MFDCNLPHMVSIPIVILICSHHLWFLYSPEVKEVGKVKRDSWGAVTAAAAPATTPTTPEPWGRDDLHRPCKRALCQHGAGPSALHDLTRTHPLPWDDPRKHRARDRVCWLRWLQTGHRRGPALHAEPPRGQADDSSREVGKGNSR